MIFARIGDSPGVLRLVKCCGRRSRGISRAVAGEERPERDAPFPRRRQGGKAAARPIPSLPARPFPLPVTPSLGSAVRGLSAGGPSFGGNIEPARPVSTSFLFLARETGFPDPPGAPGGLERLPPAAPPSMRSGGRKRNAMGCEKQRTTLQGEGMLPRSPATLSGRMRASVGRPERGRLTKPRR